MKLIFCLEKNKGTMFLGKRQSKDRVLNERLLQIVGNSKLWVSEYSSELFEPSESLVIDNDYKNKAERNDYCFVLSLQRDTKNYYFIIRGEYNYA